MKRNKNSRIPRSSRLYEMSPELARRAADKQQSLLNNKAYLRKISAWQYLKCIKRLIDFKKYADGIVYSINIGNVGSPDDIPVNLRVAREASEEASYNHNYSGSDYDDIDYLERNSVSASQRLRQIAPMKSSSKRVTHPIVPRIKDADEFNETTYFIKYISSIDNSVAIVWIDATSISDAIDQIIHGFWDVKQVSDVVPKVSVSGNRQGNVINPDTITDESAFMNNISKVVTDGEFDDMKELVADIKDDKTTQECADGNIYEGTDEVYGTVWSGRKSSYRETAEELGITLGNNANDYDIEIMTYVDSDDESRDQSEDGFFNAEVFKKTLNKGIVHFVYRKKNGSERQSFGTTCQEILSNIDGASIQASHDQQRVKNPNVIPYYDLTRHAWRCFIAKNMLIIYDESY